MPVAKKKSKKNSSNDILKKLETIEKNQKKLLKLQKKTINQEKDELKNEGLLQKEEVQELDELKKLEYLEKRIQSDVKVNPLGKVTKRDVVKGILGALFGIVGHFAFAEGAHLSEGYTYTRSTFLLITSFVIVVLFLYFAGFRKVNDIFVFKILPIRALVIYFAAIFTIVIVLLVYGKIDFHTEFSVIYNSVAAISILAVLGAGTADLIGKQGE